MSQAMTPQGQAGRQAGAGVGMIGGGGGLVAVYGVGCLVIWQRRKR
jgi:hypothetical protein